MTINAIEIREKSISMLLNTHKTDVSAIAEIFAVQIFAYGEPIDLDNLLIIWRSVGVEVIEELRNKIGEELERVKQSRGVRK